MIGTPVQYGPAGGIGSVGKIIAKHRWPDGSFRYDVKWQYGKDARGEPVTAISRNKTGYELTVIDEADYRAAVDRKFNSGETVPYKRNLPAHQEYDEHAQIMGDGEPE